MTYNAPEYPHHIDLLPSLIPHNSEAVHAFQYAFNAWFNRNAQNKTTKGQLNV